MSTAWISALAEQAVVRDGDRWYVLVASSSDPKPGSGRHAEILSVNYSTDLTVMEADAFPYAHVYGVLTRAVVLSQTVRYSLALTDSTLQADLRRNVLDALIDLHRRAPWIEDVVADVFRHSVSHPYH